MMLHFPNAIFLYPETHFRFFKFFPSLLFKKTPEIVFDAPRRIRTRPRYADCSDRQ